MLLPAVICSIFSVAIALIINWKLALLCGFQFPAFFMSRLVELRIFFIILLFFKFLNAQINKLRKKHLFYLSFCK